MDVQTFKAATMQEALATVRKTLGPDALILHTRQVPRQGRMPWQRDAMDTEITATTDEQLSAEVPHRTAPLKQPTRNRYQGAPSEPTLSSTIESDRFKQQIQEELESAWEPRFLELKGMLESLRSEISTKSQAGSYRGWSAPLTQLQQTLLDQDLPPRLVQQLISELSQRNIQDVCHPAGQQQLQEMLQNRVQCQGPIQVKRNARRVVALVGPTGVGKTTTIAKLAANFRLREGLNMGLVTIDTYRIAAVEQLRTYAEIIDLPMEVVTDRAELDQALQKFSGLDLVLIDTAGRSPHDELKLKQLTELFTNAPIDEIHLVLSCVASERSVRTAAEKFAAIQPTAMLATKRDEADSPACLLNLHEITKLPLSYVTMGQDVPDDIELADAYDISHNFLETLLATHQLSTHHHSLAA